MSGRILRFRDPHQTVDALLPWFVNGTLEVEERALVERHLGECARCRQELEELRAFQAFYASTDLAERPAGLPDELLRRLNSPGPRGGDDGSAAKPPKPARWWPFPALGHWAAWAAAVEMAVILVLVGMLLAIHEAPAPYRTLAAPEPPLQAMSRLVVVFDAQLSEAELRRIVLNAGARIVDGPTVTDAYVLEVPARRQAAALQALRGERGVALAEGLSAGTAP